MSKRGSFTDFYGQKKRFRLGTSSEGQLNKSCEFDTNIINASEIPSDTESALIYLKSTFPLQKFENQLPPILLIHQIYSIVKSRTTVDKEVRSLQSKGTIRLFKLGGEESVLVAIFTSDLNEHVIKRCPSKSVFDRYLNVVLPGAQDVAIDKNVLKEKFLLTEHDICDLVGAGLLTLRSASSLWFSFPNSGEFVRSYLKGRKSVLRSIKKCKFSEIMQSELEQRKLEKSVRLGMMYHIHDLIGAELVKCIETTSGKLLRFIKK